MAIKKGTLDELLAGRDPVPQRLGPRECLYRRLVVALLIVQFAAVPPAS